MRLREIESISGAHMIVDGREMLNFTGCCYLGICGEPELIEAGTKALKRCGSLGQIPRHYGALAKPYADAEAAAVEYFQSEAAMFFAAGYLFASIALQGLSAKYDVIFLDEKAHYSIRDGAAATHKPVVWFRHTDVEDLEQKLRENLKEGQRPMVATDGMFPTYGNIPPLDAYARCLEPYDGWMVVDESHSLGVFGDHGRGIVEKFNLPRTRIVAGGSMAKAFCAYGAVAVGTKECIEDMRKSAPARGAASGMTAAAAMTAASLFYVARHPELLAKLRQIIAYTKRRVNELGIAVEETESPNVTFSVGSPEEMQRIQANLLEEDIYIMYSNYIGAAEGGVLRCSLFADHTVEDIDRLISALKKNLP
jgi:8-amino-7-oxononanoate synthase